MGESRITGVGGINTNLSPDAFHRWATHYYKCRHDFVSPHKFSPVPYFLLCRAIELELKSRHLKNQTQPQVKNAFWHDLIKVYTALSKNEQILTPSELITLQQANDIYKDKGFEYFEPEDALTGYRRFPDLVTLDTIAKKLLGIYKAKITSAADASKNVDKL